MYSINVFTAVFWGRGSCERDTAAAVLEERSGVTVI